VQNNSRDAIETISAHGPYDKLAVCRQQCNWIDLLHGILLIEALEPFISGYDAVLQDIQGSLDQGRRERRASC